VRMTLGGQIHIEVVPSKSPVARITLYGRANKIDAWLVSRFRSSQLFTEPRFELRNRKDTSKPIDLVWLWFRSSHLRTRGTNDANFRTSTPEASSSAVVVGIVVTGIGACLARGAP